MLKITVPTMRFYDEAKEEFFYSPNQKLELEHSLVSLSKWEAKWNIPFLSKDTKTEEQTLDYIRCMTMTQNVDPLVYRALTQAHFDLVSKYIDQPMTATTFPKDRNKTINREIITSEIIYYWMIALNIPDKYEKWHLNRLLTLINVCNIKNQPKKKMGKKALLARNRQLNEERKASLQTSG